MTLNRCVFSAFHFPPPPQKKKRQVRSPTLRRLGSCCISPSFPTILKNQCILLWSFFGWHFFPFSFFCPKVFEEKVVCSKKLGLELSSKHGFYLCGMTCGISWSKNFIDLDEIEAKSWDKNRPKKLTKRKPAPEKIQRAPTRKWIIFQASMFQGRVVKLQGCNSDDSCGGNRVLELVGTERAWSRLWFLFMAFVLRGFIYGWCFSNLPESQSFLDDWKMFVIPGVNCLSFSYGGGRILWNINSSRSVGEKGKDSTYQEAIPKWNQSSNPYFSGAMLV